METFIPKFKVKAKSQQEADEIGKMFSNMNEKMSYPILLEAARKVNGNPQKKVKKIQNAISYL